tara:strand:+ start:61 stop:279 length:219 start_codon:yes stop_codon:yes gene_type:complete
MIVNMITKLKNSFPLIVLGVLGALFVLLLEPAIRFFFRGFLLLLENPLEGAAFFGILGTFMGIWIWLEEKNL